MSLFLKAEAKLTAAGGLALVISGGVIVLSMYGNELWFIESEERK